MFRQGWRQKFKVEVHCKCGHSQVCHYTRDGHCIACACLEYKSKGNANFPNKRSKCNYGHAHDSGEEIKYCAQLHYRLLAKDIKGFDAQVTVELLGPSGAVVGKYKVDFVVQANDGATEYHEVKGSHLLKKTAWPLKWALLQDKHKGDRRYRFQVIVC